MNVEVVQHSLDDRLDAFQQQQHVLNDEDGDETNHEAVEAEPQ